jgi:hypothetical protein
MRLYAFGGNDPGPEVSYDASRERDAFTTRWLMALKTSQADGDSKNVRVIIDALAKAHGIPANYPNAEMQA